MSILASCIAFLAPVLTDGSSLDIEGAQLTFHSASEANSEPSAIQLEFAVGRFDDPVGSEGSLVSLAESLERRAPGWSARPLPTRLILALDRESARPVHDWNALASALLAPAPTASRRSRGELPDDGEIRWLASGLAYGFESARARELDPAAKLTSDDAELARWASAQLTRAGLRVDVWLKPNDPGLRAEWTSRVRELALALPVSRPQPSSSAALSYPPSAGEVYWLRQDNGPLRAGALIPDVPLGGDDGRARAASLQADLPAELHATVEWTTLTHERGVLWITAAWRRDRPQSLVEFVQATGEPAAWVVVSAPSSVREKWSPDLRVVALPTADERRGTPKGRARARELVDAMGGRARWAQLTSLHTNARIHIPDPNVERVYTIAAWKDFDLGRFRIDTRAPGGSVTSDRVWPSRGERIASHVTLALPPAEHRRYRQGDAVSLYRLLRGLALDSLAARLDSSDALVVLGPAGPIARIELDRRSRPAALTVPGASGERRFVYDAFAEHNEYVYPKSYHQETATGAEGPSFEVDAFQPNCPVDFFSAP